jgi:type IV pilus assembly protein PilE
MELLVATSIIAVLAALAYPSYRAQVAQSRRAEMQSQLVMLAQYFERKHAEFGCYDYGNDADCTTSDDSGPPPFVGQYDYYNVTVVEGSLGNHTFRLEAAPIGTQAGDGSLYIDHAQRKRWDEDNDTEIDSTTERNWHRG